MKKNILLIMAIAATSIASVAQAGESGYLGKRYVSAIYSKQADTDFLKNSNGISAGVNLPLINSLDLSFAVSNTSYDLTFFDETLDVSELKLGAAVTYYVQNKSMVTPYVGAGVGFVSVKESLDGLEATNSESFTTLGAGLQIEPMNKVVLNTGYSLLLIDGESMGSVSFTASYWFTNSFSAGVSYVINEDTAGFGLGVSYSL